MTTVVTGSQLAGTGQLLSSATSATETILETVDPGFISSIRSGGTSLGTDLLDTFDNLFGADNDPTSSPVAAGVIPDITAAMSSGITGILNAIGNALGLGSSGNTVTGISTPLVEVLGPCSFRAHSTAGSTSVANAAGLIAYPLTLDTTDYNTGGFTFASNAVTVPVKGLYAVKVGLAYAGATINSGACVILTPVVEQNGSPARYGCSLPLFSGAGSAAWMADTFLIECNASDVLSPALNKNATTSLKVEGDSIGSMAYFEVTLVRKDA